MKAAVERCYPYVGGVILAGTYALFARHFVRLGCRMAVDPVAVFGSMFNLGAVLTGFLFTVYILAIAPSGSFIEKIFTTRTFQMFRRYVVEAMCLGAAATIVSWPLGVLDKPHFTIDVMWTTVLSGWTFVSTAALLSFFRVGYIFFILSKYPRKD